METLLSSIYYNPQHPASFGSFLKLYKAAKPYLQNITLDDVKRWLSSQNTYTLHRRVVRKHETVPFYADHVDSTWVMDTADVRHLAADNDGIKYFFIIIDVVSRFAFVVPMENKSAPRLVKAFQHIKNEYGRSPKLVVSDPGLEFRGAFTKYLQESNIDQYLLRAKQKATLAERFIRTIKEKMLKFMSHYGTKRYIDSLGELVRSYNYAVHSRTRMRPVDVTLENEQEVKARLYGRYGNWDPPTPRYGIGDMVRLARKLETLVKRSGTQTSTDQVFIVGYVDSSHPPRHLYRLKDTMGEYIKGSFYDEDLVPVKNVSDTRQYMQTDKKISKRGKIIKSFKGWPRKFNIKQE